MKKHGLPAIGYYPCICKPPDVAAQQGQNSERSARAG